MHGEKSRPAGGLEATAYASPRRIGVIHQPYFLPWLGYFSKLAFCDVFVILDNVEFTKGHYLDRTRIVNMHGEVAWLSLPTGQNLAIPITEVRLRPPDSRHLTRLIRTLAASYATAHQFDYQWPLIERLLGAALSEQNARLVDVNVELIGAILDHLQVTPPSFVRASTITTATDPTERVLDICRTSRLTDLIVGSGRSRFVHDFQRLIENGIRLHLQDYLGIHPHYSQARRRQQPFQAGLSIIDAILNVGSEETRRFISDQLYAPIPFEPVRPTLSREDPKNERAI